MQLLKDTVADYLIYLRVEQGAAKTTVKTYGPHLRHFLLWMQANGYPQPVLSDLSPVLLRRFLFSLGERNLRPMTVRSYLHSLRGMAHFAIKTNLRPDNFTEGLAMPKKDAPIRETPTDEQVRLLLEAVERDRNPRRVAQRRALLSILLWAAVRRAELLDLKVTDINLADRSLLVQRGKGNRTRLLYLPETAVSAVREWIALRGEATHPFLWCADVNRRLHIKGLAALLQDLQARAGLHTCDALKPHSLRHWRACDMLRAGADLKTISTVLGHSNVQTTAVYLHSTEREARHAAELSCLTDIRPQSPQPQEPPQNADRPRLRVVGRNDDRDRLRRRLAR